MKKLTQEQKDWAVYTYGINIEDIKCNGCEQYHVILSGPLPVEVCGYFGEILNGCKAEVCLDTFKTKAENDEKNI